VLDALLEVQKMVKPENWDILRLYAEKLLERDIPENLDDAGIAECRKDLQGLFSQEKGEASRTESAAQVLFDEIKQPNPYASELKQISDLFTVNITGSDDISRILYALKSALGYKAFDDNTASLAESDDLANRLKNCRDMRNFLKYEFAIRAAARYCAAPLEDRSDLADARAAIAAVQTKLGNLREYVDSDVTLIRKKLQ
jgi:hypothetical protein